MVRLEIVDAAGRRIARLVDSPQEPGIHEVVWRGSDDGGRPVPSGLYFARLVAAEEVLRTRVVIAR